MKFKDTVEQAHFRKDALTDTDDIDKLVTNVTFGPAFPITSRLSLELALRCLIATGRWQAMRFHHLTESFWRF